MAGRSHPGTPRHPTCMHMSTDAYEAERDVQAQHLPSDDAELDMQVRCVTDLAALRCKKAAF